MKKTLALLLVLAMLFSFAACGEAEKAEEGSKKTEEAATATENGDSAKTDISIRPGTAEGNKYTSDYSGLTINLPGDEWSFDEEDVLAEETGVPASLIEANRANALDQVSVVYDAKASDSSTGSEMTVAYQMNRTPEQYMKAEKATLDKLSGVEYEILEEKTVTLCGNEYTLMALEAEAVGTNTTRIFLARTTDDGVLVTVYINMFGVYEVSEILGYFA